MKSLALRSVLLAIFLIALITLVAFARGYRLNLEKGNFTSTGILVANSYPDGAKIYINGKLAGATKTNITLPPGKYDVEFKKNGYSSWSRNLTIKGELIVNTDALLFPQNPSLSPITSLGITHAIISPSTNKIVLITQNDDPEKNGIYLLDNAKRPISILNPLKLIALKSALPYEISRENKVDIVFSPDESQIIFSLKDKDGSLIASYLLSTDLLNSSLFEITNTEEPIVTAWEKERNENLKKILETFKEPLPQIATDSFDIVRFSPDETKFLYNAKKNMKLPQVIKPALVATNQTQEDRNLKKENLYVYDGKEDKNYLVADSTKGGSPFGRNYAWFPDNSHLVVSEKDHISVVSYDGENKQTVYSGPFEKVFFGVTPDEKLLILTNLNPQSNKLPDLYAVGIR